MKIQGIEIDDEVCEYSERDEVEDAKHISGDDRANYVFEDELF